MMIPKQLVECSPVWNVHDEQAGLEFEYRVWREKVSPSGSHHLCPIRPGREGSFGPSEKCFEGLKLLNTIHVGRLA